MKATMKQHLTPVRMAKKKKKITSNGEDVEKVGPVHCR